MKKHVLLVDDEPRFLNGLRRILLDERPDWDINIAQSADDALDRIREMDYDVVLSDVTMPGKDGFALLGAIQNNEETKDIPVIILTGAADADLKRRALELGAVDLLNKPVNPQDLLARVHSALRLKAYQDQLRDQNALLEQKVAERTEALANSRLEIIWRLGKAGEHRDEQTGNHVVRVGCYCRVLGEALGLDRELVESIFLASPLHDIGKIGIPDSVLLKRGPLNHDEWETMKQHCAIGAGILCEESRVMQAYLEWGGDRRNGRDPGIQNPILMLASSIAMTHHEWWDGTGYPSGLAGQHIPLTSRIVAIADTYDALRSKRPYKPAFSEAETLAIIRDERGSHLDPEVCEAFERSIEDLRAIRAELSDLPSQEVETECVS